MLVKKYKSLLLAFVMVFNIFVSSVGNNLVYADNNTAYTQSLSGEKTSSVSEKSPKNSKNQVEQKSKNTEQKALTKDTDKKTVAKKAEEAKNKNSDKKSGDKKVEAPKKKNLDKNIEDKKNKDSNKKDSDKKIEDKKVEDPKKNKDKDSEEKKSGKSQEKSKEDPSLEKDSKQTLPEAKEEESKRIYALKQENGLLIEVDAPKGAFPLGTSVSITLISKYRSKISYDITFRDKNNKEVQPAKGKEVKVSFTLDKSSSLITDDKPVNLKLYHVVNGVSKEIDSKITQGKSVKLSEEVNHFSEFKLVAEAGKSAILASAGQNKQVNVNITKFEIQNTNHTTANEIYQSDKFLLMMNWDATHLGSNIHKGDYFDVKLPDAMKFPSDVTARDFELKSSDGTVVAKAHVTPGPDDAGGNIRVTFTDAVENKYNVKGTMYLAAQFNLKKVKLNEENTFTVEVNGKPISDGVKVVGPTALVNEHLAKWAGKGTNSNEVTWHVRINHAGTNLSNVVVKDDFSGTGQKLIDGRFKLYRVKFNKFGDIDTILETLNASSKITVNANKDGFTLNLGNIGTASYVLEYDTTYTPGTSLRNKLRLDASNGKSFATHSIYRSAESGGTGDGDLASKIKLIKVDADNEQIKLANAVFEVTKPNGQKFELKTGANGEVVSNILEQGDYKVREKTAPKGYLPSQEEHILKVTPAGGAIKKITNKPIKIDVKVKKTWVGKKLDSCLVKLYADDVEKETITLNEGNSWKHTFTNLRKFKPDGTEIKYSVKEVVPNGYKAEYSGSADTEFVVKNTQDTTSIKATKTWVDGPAAKPTIWFKLYRKLATDPSLTAVENAPVKELANGNTEVTWDNLPKTDDQGREYTYSVKEGVVVNGVFTEKTPDNYLKTENGLNITNKYTSPKIKIEVDKIWDDDDNNGGSVARSANGNPTIKIQLYKNGQAEGSPVELTNGNFKYVWTNLDKTDKDGNDYTYTVKEVGENNGRIKLGITWYKVEYSGNATSGFVIKNKKDSTSITATKVWDGGPSTKPTIWFKLYRKVAGDAEAKPVENAEVKELTSGNTEVTWNDLPKADDQGREYTYSVKEGVLENGQFKEKDPSNYYKSKVEDLTITNRYCSPNTEIKVKKIWENADGTPLQGNKPTVKLQLYKNGQPEGNPVELNNEKTEHTWKNLKKTDRNGVDYKYTVKEVDEVNGNIKIGNTWYKVTYGEDAQKVLTVKNKKIPPLTPMEPPFRDIKVVKNWELLGTEKPVEKIEVELYKDGVATGNKLELNKTNNWTGEFKKLPVAEKLGSTNYYNYTVKEVGENAGSIKFGTKWFKATYTGDMKDGFKITNKELPPLTPMEPPFRDIKVVKNWELLGTEKPVEKIEVELYKDGVATGNKLELNKTNNWTGEFKKLPVAEKLGSTNYYKYTVKEIGESAGSIKFGTKWFKATYTGNMKDGFKITNKELPPLTPMEPPFRNIKVVKNWNLLGREKPVEKIEVELYRNGVATGNKLELNKDNNWSGEFKKLPVAEKLGSTNYYNYTVKEIGENAGSIVFGGMQFSVNYTGDMKDGLKITNSYTPPYTPWTPPTKEKLDLKVTKLWKDSKDNNIDEPTNKIVVELYRDGKATGKRLELNKVNKWSGEFTDLEAKSDSDEYYKYTIKEVGENGNIIKFDGKQYKVIYGGSMRDGITITNKKEEPPKPPTPPGPKTPPSPKTPPGPKTPPPPRRILPRTGDGINPSTFAWLILLLGAGLSIIGYRVRKDAK